MNGSGYSPYARHAQAVPYVLLTEKIRIVVSGLRGEESIRYSLVPPRGSTRSLRVCMYSSMSKEFLEACRSPEAVRLRRAAHPKGRQATLMARLISVVPAARRCATCPLESYVAELSDCDERSPSQKKHGSVLSSGRETRNEVSEHPMKLDDHPTVCRGSRRSSPWGSLLKLSLGQASHG